MRHRSLFMLVAPLAVLVTLSATSASAAPSITKAGCPAITRAQAEAAIGDVRGITHRTQRIYGKSYLQQCVIVFGPGFRTTEPGVEFEPAYRGEVRVSFTGDDRYMWNAARKARKSNSWKTRDVRGVGTAAYLHKTMSDSYWDLSVFHPRYSITSPGGFREQYGSFVVTQGEFSQKLESLIAVARAALAYRGR